MPRPGRPLVAGALALLGALVLPSPADALSIAPEPPRSPNAESIATAYWALIGLAGVLLVALHLAIGVAMVRFRARRGRRPARLAAARGALRPVVGALSALAVVVFVFGVVMSADVRDVEATGAEGLDGARETAQVGIGEVGEEARALEIDATAQQWVWRFNYPEGTFSYGELVVPVDTTVILNVRSIDVAHSWWVPALGGQAQALPGSVNRTWFKATEEGRYEGRSTVFSGTGFPSLRAWVRVVDVPTYLDYVEQLGEDLSAAQEAVAEEAGAEEAEGDATDAEDGTGAEEAE